MFPDFKPLNPWGRPMPKPSREMRAKPPSLYQVFVEVNGAGQQIAVGPKVGLAHAEQLFEAISTMIRRGKEKSWSNPVLVEHAPN